MNQPKVQEIIQSQKKTSAYSAISSLEAAGSEKRNSKNTYFLNSLPYIYALGRVEARFPNQSIEKEYIRSLEKSRIANAVDEQPLHSVLSQPQNRYLARKLSWVLTIDGKPTYILLPTDPEGLDALLEAIRPSAIPLDRSVIVGRKGPIAPPSKGGLDVPMALIDHLFPFEHRDLMKSMHLGPASKETFNPAVEDLFQKMMQMANNTGTTDKHRALSYLIACCPAIYAKAAEELERSFLLTSVDAISSRLSDNRNVVSVMFAFTNAEAGIVKKYLAEVDVTEEFPFIVTEISPYGER